SRRATPKKRPIPPRHRPMLMVRASQQDGACIVRPPLMATPGWPLLDRAPIAQFSSLKMVAWIGHGAETVSPVICLIAVWSMMMVADLHCRASMMVSGLWCLKVPVHHRKSPFFPQATSGLLAFLVIPRAFLRLLLSRQKMVCLK